MRKSIIAIFCLFTATANTSEIPDAFSHLELIFRSGQFDGFNIAAGSRISNSLVRVSEGGDVAITLKGIEYTADFGIWRYDSFLGSGSVVYRAPNERLISNPEFTPDGGLLFGQYDLGVNDGILKLDVNQGVSTVIDPKNLKRGDFTSNAIQLEDSSYILKTKSAEDGQAIVLVDGGAEKELISEGNGPSYIFSPSCTLKGLCALKLRMGALGEWEESRPDHIVVFDQHSERVLLRDDLGYADSFNNNVGVNDQGDVVVIAALNKEARIIATKMGKPITIAIANEANDIKEFETFAPVINNHGEVAFRAIDWRGKRSLYFFNGDKLTKVLSEGDIVPTDRETGRIEERDGWPGFSSGLVLTDKSELYFHAQLWNKSVDKNLGAALYRLPLSYLR